MKHSEQARKNLMQWVYENTKGEDKKKLTELVKKTIEEEHNNGYIRGQADVYDALKS